MKSISRRPAQLLDENGLNGGMHLELKALSNENLTRPSKIIRSSAIYISTSPLQRLNEIKRETIKQLAGILNDAGKVR